MVDDEGGSGSGGLHAGVRHEVQHSLVALMADADEHGQRHLCHSRCERVGVEIGQVAGGASTTDDHDAVPPLSLVGDGSQGRQYALFHIGALHHGREELHVEAEAVVVVCQLVAEVTVARRTCRRDHRNALQQQRQRQLAVVLQNAVGLQLRQNLAAPLGQVAQRERGVDVDDIQRVTVELVEGYGHQNPHLHACPQPFACGTLEEGGYHIIGSRPHGPARASNEASPRGILLHELHIEMAVLCQPRLAELRFQPVFAVEALLHDRAHQTVQF